MDLALLVYGISVLTQFSALLIIASVVVAISFIFSAIAYSAAYNKEDIATAKYWWKCCTIALAIVAPLLVITPNEKTMYTMVAAYAAQKVAEDPKVQQLSGKVLVMLEAKLDSYILDMAVAKDKKEVN